eukprot:sb/3468010/
MTQTLDFLFGIVELGSALVGLVLNPLTIAYFYRNRDQLSSLLYLFIVITDIGSLLSCLPSSLSMLNNREPMLLSSPALCTLSGFVFNITSRFSVFLIGLLSVARALTLLLPFRTIPRIAYIVPLVMCLVFNVLLASAPLAFSNHGYHYETFKAQCSWGVGELNFVGSRNTTLWRGITYSTIILPWLIPGCVVIISCFLCISILAKSDRRKRAMVRTTKKAYSYRHITVTILLMTLVYTLLMGHAGSYTPSFSPRNFTLYPGYRLKRASTFTYSSPG